MNRIVSVFALPWLAKTQVFSHLLETDVGYPTIMGAVMLRRLDPDLKSELSLATLKEL